LGQRPSASFYFAGYSAPELLSDRPIDERADVYSIGALLFHAFSGYPIAESGSALTGWQPETPVAGIPQILHKCLGPIETRYPSASELHRDLLRLVRRCAPRTRYECALATSIGLEPTRTVNQDAYGWLSMDSDSEEVSRKWVVAAVADGMGGMAAGERASQVAIDSLLAMAMSALSPASNSSVADQAQFTADLVRTANDRVCDAMEAKQVRGGCTLACALVIGRRLSVAHVGDCRIYLVRNSAIEMLTRDHSVAMSMVLQGQLEMKDLRTYPDRSNVTRSLGERRKPPDYYVDTLKQTKGDQYLELQPGDTLMICSDGLWEPVTEDAAIQVLTESGQNLSAAADRLVNLALQHGAPDNATVALLRIDEPISQ
jgi:protein phosphatase